MGKYWRDEIADGFTKNRRPAPVFVVMSGEYLLDKKEEIIQ
ncbi:tail assembly protein [Escherichia coli]|nr:tail assembly protein [Escherichia coli]EJF7330261.1 tail assembly protein [Escherichia coli]MBF5855070.1 tail assembly protein [Escherichia coli]